MFFEMKTNLQLLILLVSTLFLVLFFFIPTELTKQVINKIQLDTFGHIIGFFGLTWILVGLVKLPLMNTVICLYFYILRQQYLHEKYYRTLALISLAF